MRVAIMRKFDTGDSVFAWRVLVVLVLTTIVIHSWAWDNSSLARDTPFSNTTPTRRFQRERDSGSTQPIFRIKADSVREKVHLSFAARRFLKRRENFQKFSFENGLHTKKSPFLLYFQVQRDNAYSYSIFFILGSICRYIIHLQKAARRFLRFGFWKAGKQVLSAQPDQFEPFLLLLSAFLSQPAFKFAASLIMNN